MDRIYLFLAGTKRTVVAWGPASIRDDHLILWTHPEGATRSRGRRRILCASIESVEVHHADRSIERMPFEEFRQQLVAGQ